MILVFDLDDTLYPEISYVLSGFKQVSRYLNIKLQIDYQESYYRMTQSLLNRGRRKVFDEVLQHFDIYSKENVKNCISAYRSHYPNISLDKEAVDCFERFKGLKKYIVTDGNKIVQDNKIKALNVEKYMNNILITHRYGIRHAKPSPYCFHKISEWEKIPMSEIIYVGDNPNKDFVGIKPAGCKTIRINQGMYMDYFLDSNYEADLTIQNINELNQGLLKKIL